MNPHLARLKNVRRLIRRAEVDGLYVSALVNIRYLTGFTGSAGHLIVTRDEAILYTDGRYQTQAGEQTAGLGVEVVIFREKPVENFLDEVRKKRFQRLGIEVNRLSHAMFRQLKKSAPRRKLVELNGLVEGLRAIKSDEEIAAIRRSIELNSKALDLACAKARPSWTEARLAAEIDHAARTLGASRPAFETIVASGAHGGLPHAQPRNVRLVPRSMVVIDQGAILDGYTSDMTRMVAFGRPGPEQRDVFQAVLESQLAAIDSVKAGVSARTVDRAARTTLKRFKLDEFFVHSTGHGLGLEVHEGPRLRPNEDQRLKSGMVITIEPGVYLEGRFGVRIEDVVVVRPNGCEVLTPTPRELRVL